MAQPVRVLVTGAAGQIGYTITNMIANGNVFGPNQPLILVMLDIPGTENVLQGVAMELNDCSFPLLREVVTCTDEATGFKDLDYAFLVGAMPRKEGMERKDLLAANVKIFKSQGTSLHKAKATCKVLVVGNPANTNANICAKYAAPHIPAKNIHAMTRLDHNRAMHQIAAKCGLPVTSVKNVIIWGNHSATQFPDVAHAEVMKDGKWVPAKPVVNDEAWLHGEFIKTVQQRGAAVIKLRKLSSAMSAAKSACDHMHSWVQGTPAGVWYSMAVPSDGSYNIAPGVIYSFPCTVDANTKEYSIVQGLSISDFAREKMTITDQELRAEMNDALAACQ
jgi:malate dehydrogenase